MSQSTSTFLTSSELTEEDLFQFKTQVQILLDYHIKILKDLNTELERKQKLKKQVAEAKKKWEETLVEHMKLERFNEYVDIRARYDNEKLRGLTYQATPPSPSSSSSSSLLSSPPRVPEEILQGEIRCLAIEKDRFQRSVIQSVTNVSDLTSNIMRVALEEQKRIQKATIDMLKEEIHQTIDSSRYQWREVQTDEHPDWTITEMNNKWDRILTNIYRPTYNDEQLLMALTKACQNLEIDRNATDSLAMKLFNLIEPIAEDLMHWIEIRRKVNNLNDVENVLLPAKHYMLDTIQQTRDAIRALPIPLLSSSSSLPLVEISEVIEPLDTLETELRYLTDTEEKDIIDFIAPINVCENRLIQVQEVNETQKLILEVIYLKVDIASAIKSSSSAPGGNDAAILESEIRTLMIQLHNHQEILMTRKNMIPVQINPDNFFGTFQSHILRNWIKQSGDLSIQQINWDEEVDVDPEDEDAMDEEEDRQRERDRIKQQQQQQGGNIFDQPVNHRLVRFTLPELERRIRTEYASKIDKMVDQYNRDHPLTPQPLRSHQVMRQMIDELVRRHVNENPTAVVSATKPKSNSEILGLIYWASQNNHVKVLRELKTKYGVTANFFTTDCDHDVLKFASWNGNLDLLEFLLKEIGSDNGGIMSQAYFARTTYSDSQFHQVNLAMMFATRKDQSEVLDFLVTKCSFAGVDFQRYCPELVVIAASSGSLKVLEYLYAKDLLDPFPQQQPQQHPDLFHGDIFQANGMIIQPSAAIIGAADAGHINVLEFYRTRLQCPAGHFFVNNYTILTTSVIHNQLEAFKYLVTQFRIDAQILVNAFNNPIYIACIKGRVKFLDYFLNVMNVPANEFISDGGNLHYHTLAILNDQPESLRWFIKQNRSTRASFQLDREMIMMHIFETGNKEMLQILKADAKFIHDDIVFDNKSFNQPLMKLVIDRNHKLIEYLHQEYGLTGEDFLVSDQRPLLLCVREDDVELFRYIHQTLGLPNETLRKLGPTIIRHAADSGASNILMYLSQECGFTKEDMLTDKYMALRVAARRGHTSVFVVYRDRLQLVTNEDLKFRNYCLVRDVMEGGHVNLLIYLHLQAKFTKAELLGGTNTPYESSIQIAASLGHLEIIKYFHVGLGVTEEEFKALPELLHVVVDKGKVLILDYLHRHLHFGRKEFEIGDGVLIRLAVYRQNLFVLQFLYSEISLPRKLFRCDKDWPLITALSMRSHDIIRFLLSDVRLRFTDQEIKDRRLLFHAMNTGDISIIIGICTAGINGSIGYEALSGLDPESDPIAYAHRIGVPTDILNYLKRLREAASQSQRNRTPSM